MGEKEAITGLHREWKVPVEGRRHLLVLASADFSRSSAPVTLEARVMWPRCSRDGETLLLKVMFELTYWMFFVAIKS